MTGQENMSHFKGKLNAGRACADYINSFLARVRFCYKLLQNVGKASMADSIKIVNIGVIH